MNVLTLEDLLEVSMFRCKVCDRRLQSPVLQVGMFGNICGGICYERSVFTDVIRNVDVETLLAKLQVPCKYKERGCTYDGSYYKTCRHERGCEFRDKICPLTYLRTCDDVTGYFNDISAHISSCHQEYVLMGALNCPIDVPNPTESNRDLFYLLNLDNKKFLLRTWIDSSGLCIFYAFYSFQTDIDLKSINISININWENRIFSITDISVSHVQPESAISSMYDIDNAFRIPIATLKSLNSLEVVKISININEERAIKTIPAKTQLKRNVSINMFRCTYCPKIQHTIQICKYCRNRACVNCTMTSCPSSSVKHNWDTVHFTELGIVYDVFCQNQGCQYVIKSDEIDRHETICSFKKHRCPYHGQAQCKWHGVIKNMAAHITDAHPNLVNLNIFSVETSKDIYFVRGVCVFKQNFNLSLKGELSITTTVIYGCDSGDSYKWEVRVKREDTPMMMVITDVCNREGQQKTIKVKNYIANKKLTLYADIKSAETSVIFSADLMD